MSISNFAFAHTNDGTRHIYLVMHFTGTGLKLSNEILHNLTHYLVLLDCRDGAQCRKKPLGEFHFNGFSFICCFCFFWPFEKSSNDYCAAVLRLLLGIAFSQTCDLKYISVARAPMRKWHLQVPNHLL